MKKNMQILAIIALISTTSNHAGVFDWLTGGTAPNYTVSPTSTPTTRPEKESEYLPNRTKEANTPLEKPEYLPSRYSLVERLRRYFTPSTNVQTGPSGTKWFDKQGRIIEEVRKTPEGPVTTTYTYPKKPSIWEKLARGARKSRYQQAPEKYPTYAQVLQPIDPNEPTSIEITGPKEEDWKLKRLGDKTHRIYREPGAFSIQAKKAYKRSME